MKNRFFVILVLSSIIIFLVPLTVFQLQSLPKQVVTQKQVLGSQTSFSISESVDFGGTKPETSKIVEVKDGETAMDVLLKSEKVEVKKYSFGMMVESINDVKGSGENFWLYFVNGKEASVGASDYKVKPNDEIKWVLTKNEK